MALKKSQLYSSLWKSCDELRGGMDASQYKDYVLTLLFMKYVSDKYAAEPDPIIKVPEDGGFAQMVASKGQKDIGDRINKVIGRFAEANELKGVIDQADFNDESKLGRGKAMQDRLTKLVAIFEGLDFSANRAGGDDLLGDAYEYLMRHFATQSGKAKGQFYTPSEVSRIMAQVIGIGPNTRQDRTIYDPTCGSGSLLLKAADQAPRGLTIYGQEMDNATWGLARMNMILHGHPTADLELGNTLADPRFVSGNGLKTFDFAVANPPFSTKSWSNGLDPLNDEFDRFEDGIPPDKNGDFAFLLHLVASLKSRGKGAIILPHGVLFRGNREAGIRRNLIRRGLVKGVIGLPANLFYGTGIPACILVVDKEDAHVRQGVFMMDASKGFCKDGPKNRLRAQDIHRIVDVFTSATEVPGYSRMVSFAEIADPANDYNLNIPRYIDSSEPEDLHDLDAHLNGGIPDRDLDALEEYWAVFPTMRPTLFKASGRPRYSDLRIAPGDVRTTVLANGDFISFGSQVAVVFNGWCDAHRGNLRGVSPATVPQDLAGHLAEDLLSRFDGVPLLDRYDLYQCLMDYWDETMQDDVYSIAANGWVSAAQPRLITHVTGVKGRSREEPDLIVEKQKWKMDLVPPALMVVRYFACDGAAVEQLRVVYEATERELDQFLEEHVGEGGLLEGAANGQGNRVTKRRVADLGEPEHDGDRALYRRCLDLFDARDEARRAARAAQEELNARVLGRYATLTESAVKELAIEDKWLGHLRSATKSLTGLATEALVVRVESLAERYARPLPLLEHDLATAQRKAHVHLQQVLAHCPGTTATSDSAP